MSTYQPVDYLNASATNLAASCKLMSMNATWSHITDGVLPTLSPEDRCESIMPMNIEVGASPQSMAGQSKVKPTGKVELTLAHIFGDRVVFLRWSGMLKLKYEQVTVPYSEVQAVNPVEYRVKMNTMPGFEIMTTSGRIPVIGNDPYKFDKDLLARWNRRLMFRLDGTWQPTWADDGPYVEKWSTPTPPA